MKLIQRPCVASLPRVLFVALIAASSAHGQQTWYVDDDATPPGAGTAQAPFPTIQAAIQASSDGDAVAVLPGTYLESLDLSGKAIRVVGVAGPAATVIDPQYTGRGVIFGNGETRSTVLQGFTVQHGEFQQGGGILCAGTGPTIRECIVQDNLTVDRGGGIACIAGSTARIEGCVVRRNVAQPGGGRGGGIFLGNSAVVELVGNRILDNTSFSDPDGFGAGIYVQGATVLLLHNVIAFNRADDYGGNLGGGIYTTGTCELTLEGNVVAHNLAASGMYAPGFGGGLYAGFGCTLHLRNNVFWGNTGEVGSQVYVAGTGEADHNVFEGGLEAVAGGGVLQYGAGNLSADPLFVNAAARDFHVRSRSPVVDAGDPATPPGGTDADGDPRRLDGDADGVERIDIGWDEVNATELQVVGALSPGGSVSLKTLAPPGQVFLHLVGLRAIDVTLSPFGALLVGGPLLRIGTGVVPGATDLAVPPDPSLVGLGLHFQSLARSPDVLVGSFSRRVSLVVQ